MPSTARGPPKTTHPHPRSSFPPPGKFACSCARQDWALLPGFAVLLRGWGLPGIASEGAPRLGSGAAPPSLSARILRVPHRGLGAPAEDAGLPGSGEWVSARRRLFPPVTPLVQIFPGPAPPWLVFQRPSGEAQVVGGAGAPGLRERAGDSRRARKGRNPGGGVGCAGAEGEPGPRVKRGRRLRPLRRGLRATDTTEKWSNFQSPSRTVSLLQSTETMGEGRERTTKNFRSRCGDPRRKF